MGQTAESARVAAAVRSARQRRGWNREALAHASGLSFAAITQIESGRRTELRVSTLVALADALQVSVDYLVRAEVTALFEHQAFVYETVDDLAAFAEREALNGLRANNAVLIVAPQPAIAAIRRRLGSDGRRITFAAGPDWYTTPAQTAQRYLAFARDARNNNANWVDIFGEPVWTGKNAAETRPWAKYESMLNVAFAPWPITARCLYDLPHLPKSIRAEVDRTHPTVVTRNGSHATLMHEPMEFVTA